MKKQTIWRNLIFLTLWLAIGIIAIVAFVPQFFTARDTAPNIAALPESASPAPINDASAPHYFVSESTTAGGAAPPTAESSADASGPMLAAPTEVAPGAAAPGASIQDYSQYGIAASPGAAAPPAESDQAESYQPWASNDWHSNEYGNAPGAAAPDLPGTPAPNEPGQSAGEEEATVESVAPRTGSVGDADAIGEGETPNDPLQPASVPDSHGSLGSIGSGEGGGGSGEGIGLGSIGTIGHGSGTGEGYGSGHGRASVHSQTHEIVIDESAKPPLPPDAIIAAPDDAMSEVDRKLAALPLGNIAFNTPETIPLGNTATIELLVSTKEAEEQLRQSIRGSGPIESAQGVQISDQMEAKVTGLGFRIEAVTPERQAVSHTQETRWRWQIEPTKSDTLELNLTLSALIKIGGEPSARTICTFEKKILVKVPFGQRLTTAISNNFELLTTVILLPVAGGTWRYVRKRKRGMIASEDDPEAPRRAA
ncbi:MAG TPA: hypothetical protein VGM76_13775 [Lacipirellulaceae bacterium]|jgi:hypothetical protein